MAPILVVDDDNISLQIVSAQLRKAGHSVQPVTDGYQALEFLEKEFFHLMVTDASMPLVSGYSLVSTLRKNVKFENLSIIFVTGKRGKADVMRALKSGVDDYVIKPIEHTTLIDKVSALLASKQNTPLSEKTMADFDAVYTVKFNVTEVSEHGLILKSAHALPLDFKLQIQSKVFEEMKIKSPVLRIVG